MMRVHGACHCGAISFTAEIDPARVMLCHCTDCQVLSGSPYRHVVPAPVESFAMSGKPKTYVKVAQSGNRRVQAFCPDCGTPLYAAAEESPTWVSIRLGCVRERATLAPSAQIWHRSALPWVDMLPSLPTSPEQQAISVAAPR